MADEEVVIVEEEVGGGDDPLGLQTEEKPQESAEDGKKSLKKKLLIFGLPSLLLVILLAAVGIYFLSKAHKNEVNVTEEINETAKPGKKPKISASELERLIEKAKALYDSGDKDGALKLFGEISIYSEAVSNYNLGVAKMGEKDYAGALAYFKNSLKSADNELPSAINSCVCYLKLGDKVAAKEYLSLAKASLPKYTGSPLYSYYYALINYYEGNYYEALSAVSAPTSKFFKNESSEIAKRAYLLFDDSVDMLEILKSEKSKDFLTIGFLHARNGSYREAIDAFENAKKTGQDRVTAQMAESLTYLKAKMPVQASVTLKDAVAISDDNASKIFNVKIFLKDRAFESDKIQTQVLNSFLNNNKTTASIIFYFAPYKIFNPNKTVSTIKKGEAGLLVDDVRAATTYLESAAKQSRINAEMVKGIDYALSGRVYLANKTFKAIESKFPTHSVLLYDLALTYAQSGDYREAYKYFLKAYHFDPKNYDAGIFSIITAKIIGAPYDKTKESLEADIFSGGGALSRSDTAAMFSFVLDNSVSTIDWLTNVPKKDAMSHALAVLISSKLGKRATALQSAKALADASPRDVVANGINLLIKNSGENVKIFARQTQEYINRGNYDLTNVYYGPDIAKDMFVALHRVSGLLMKAKETYEKRLALEKMDRAQLLKGYGATLMYLKMFEGANKAYSSAIFDYDFVNADTLFMAGSSAIASGKSPDAISFFELAKLYDPTSMESIYALGLLYLEAANLNQAGSHFRQLKDGFDSEFFDFDLR